MKRSVARTDCVGTRAPIDKVVDGEMAERTNATVLKTVDLTGSGGSNPPLSATRNPSQLTGVSSLTATGCPLLLQVVFGDLREHV